MTVGVDPDDALRTPETPAEAALLEAIRAGRPLDLRTGDADADDPANASSWGEERLIRGAFVRAALVDQVTRDPIGIHGARIDGAVELEALTLDVPLRFRRCRFDDFVSLQEARLPSLTIEHCRLPVLFANHLRTRGSVHLNHAHLTAVHLLGAHIGGLLTMLGTHVDNAGGIAIVADGITVDQDVFCRSGFEATGQTRLIGAHIGGQLSFANARLVNDGGTALLADNIVVDQNLTCSPSFEAVGELRLLGARISGQIDFEDAQLHNEGGAALDAERATIANSFIGGGLAVVGELCFVDATVHGALALNGAKLSNPTKTALNAANLTVHGFVTLGAATAVGTVSFRDAHITDSLDVGDAQLDAGGADSALVLQSAKVDKNLWLRPASVDGTVDLSAAHAGCLADDPQSWPQRMLLSGFTYDRFPPRMTLPAAQRLAWLARDPSNYSPQPYEQLIAVYRRTGHDEHAREVGIAKERHRRERSGWRRRQWSRFLRWTVGYGYAPWRAGYWLLGLLALGSIGFGALHPSHFEAARTGHDVHVPAFQSFIYSVDLLIPFVNLHQRDSWVPQDAAQWAAAVFTLGGWMLATVAIGALTGLMKRDG